MLKSTLILLIAIFFTSCAKDYTATKKVLPTLITKANECKNDSNRDYELDCYELIAYKNSVALLRLAVDNYKKGNYEKAAKQLAYVYKDENFYANSVMSDILKINAKTQKQNEEVLKLLEDVKHVDPIAAYKLYFYYKSISNEKEALKVLTFAANNYVKEAQVELSKNYANGYLVPTDLALSLYWLKEAETSPKDKVYEIYGVKDYFK